MFIHVNLYHVILDATDDKLFISTHHTTGKKIITTDRSTAIAVLGSNGIIRPLVEKSLTEDFYNVLELIPVNTLPEDYAPGIYTYDNGEFIKYEGVVPANNKELTMDIVIAEHDITDIRDGIIETAEIVDANTSDIRDLREGLIELANEIEK